MPVREPCKQLNRLSTCQVSRLIVNLCSKFSEWIQIYEIISEEELQGDLKLFQDLKHAYCIPVQIKNDVLKECLQIWNVTKTSIGSSVEIIYFLIRYFFSDKNWKWDYALRSELEESVKALLMVKPKLINLHVVSSIDIALLERTPLIDIVRLELDFNVTDEHFSVIGRCCTKLEVFQASLKFHYVNYTGALKFCFKDYPTNTVKNTACTTLKTITALANDDTSMVFIKNCTNLSILRTANLMLDYSNLLIENEKLDSSAFPCNIEFIGALTFPELVPFEDIYRDFPKVKILSAMCNVPEDIIPYSTVNVLVLAVINNIQTPNTPSFIFPSWPSLHTLSLVFGNEIAPKVDITAIARNCPNLRNLSLFNCTETQDEESPVPFRNLEVLHILETEQANGGTLVLSQCGATLKLFMLYKHHSSIDYSLDVDTEISEVLKSTDFPCLESLMFEPKLNCGKEVIFSFVERFPNLKIFGIVEDVNLCAELKQEIVERNWWLTIAENDAVAESDIMSIFK